MDEESVMKRIAIIQSAFVPWKGFFDLIGRCDVYVIYDSSTFSKGHWHNRNKIKRATGDPWLTVPVKTSGKLGQPIDQVSVADEWADRHWSIIADAYRTTPFFERESNSLKSLFESVSSEPSLSNINEIFIRWIARRLSLNVEILRDRDLELVGDRNERLVNICTALGATHYLSGPSAKEYLELDPFREAGVSLEWMNYGPYPQYDQPHGAFEHAVSIIDTLLCCGPDAQNVFRSAP